MATFALLFATFRITVRRGGLGLRTTVRFTGGQVTTDRGAALGLAAVFAASPIMAFPLVIGPAGHAAAIALLAAAGIALALPVPRRGSSGRERGHISPICHLCTLPAWTLRAFRTSKWSKSE